jgi:hypothetical protein
MAAPFVRIRGSKDHGDLKGQDVGVFLVDDGGTETLLPVIGLTLRVAGRQSVAMLEVIVEDIQIDGVRSALARMLPKVHRDTTELRRDGEATDAMVRAIGLKDG